MLLRSSALPAKQSITIPPGYFIPIEIDTFSNVSQVSYEATSNISISFAFMNSNQFHIFNSTSLGITNAITYETGTSSKKDLQVSKGQYFLVFYDSSDTDTANVTFAYQAYPNTPYNSGQVTSPQPTGLASFGIYNESGNVVPYNVSSTRIVGAANITSILAHNATAPQYSDTISGATLQLNSMLVVQDKNGSFPQVYWVQDTPDFVTNSDSVSFGDNIWNNTDEVGFLSNSTITSQNGNFVYPTYSNDSTSQYYYGYGTFNYTYSLPLDLDLIINESAELGQGIFLQIGSQILKNGSSSAPSPVNWFDNITINDKNVETASFLVFGNRSTPIGDFYDTELVFGGEGNLESTFFEQLNATIGLSYLNGTSLVPFPSYYSFGGDTGEAADNLQVSYFGNGIAQITPGTPNYVYLVSSNSTTINTSSTYNTAGGNSFGGSTSISSVFISNTSVSPTSLQFSNSNVLLLLVAVSVFVIAIIVGLGMSHARRNHNSRWVQ